ncbi:MAG: ATP-binding protein, partial [Lentisphaerae bacterium]|nr:ATP-binding protein [Lentisphaerota bacterium]
MDRFFNIAGPCNPVDHYMLSATERLPEVVSLIRKKQYFVIHAQRQCGKTTAILALRNEINAGSERVAMYCSLEAAEGVADPVKGIPIVYSLIQNAAGQVASLAGCPAC